MPQMAPIWWSTMYIMFILSYLLIMMMVYFFCNYHMSEKSQEGNKINNIDWKW